MRRGVAFTPNIPIGASTQKPVPVASSKSLSSQDENATETETTETKSLPASSSDQSLKSDEIKSIIEHIKANKAYQNALNIALKSLEKAMTRNLKLQKQLNKEIPASRSRPNPHILLDVRSKKRSTKDQSDTGNDSDDEYADQVGLEDEITGFSGSAISIRRDYRVPYFLDPQGQLPPYNSDTLASIKRLESGFIHAYSPEATDFVPTFWTSFSGTTPSISNLSSASSSSVRDPSKRRKFTAADHQKLRLAVRQQNQQLLFSKLYENFANLGAADLDRFDRERNAISNMSESELEMDCSQIDWAQISKSCFPSRSPSELAFEWKSFCDPKYKRGPWTAEEDQQLAKVAEKYGGRNWEAIARELGNQRLTLHYFTRYQQGLAAKDPSSKKGTKGSSKGKNVSVIDLMDDQTHQSQNQSQTNNNTRNAVASGNDANINSANSKDNETNRTHESLSPNKVVGGFKWTDEEDRKLKEAVKKFGEKNWQLVGNAIGGRTGQQCLHRWQKTLNPDIRRGKWKLHEDNRLALAIKAYGAKNWALVQKHVQGRTDVQCRERWVNVLDPAVIGNDDWTSVEDNLLLDLVTKHEQGKWSLVAKDLAVALKLYYESHVEDFAENYKPKTRTDNACWRRWKALTRSKAAPKSTRAKSTSSKSKKTKNAESEFDWEDEESDEEEMVSRRRRSTKATVAPRTSNRIPNSQILRITRNQVQSDQMIGREEDDKIEARIEDDHIQDDPQQDTLPQEAAPILNHHDTLNVNIDRTSDSLHSSTSMRDSIHSMNQPQDSDIHLDGEPRRSSRYRKKDDDGPAPKRRKLE